MFLAEREILPPKYFEHDPKICSNIGATVAMILDVIQDMDVPK